MRACAHTHIHAHLGERLRQLRATSYTSKLWGKHANLPTQNQSGAVLAFPCELRHKLNDGGGCVFFFFFLLVCHSVAAVEQLLSGEPVLWYIAGLAADQVVRHGALLLLLLLVRPAQLLHYFEN